MSQGQADILDSGARPPSGPYETDPKSCYPDEAAESKVMGVTEFVEEVVSCFPKLSEESVAERVLGIVHVTIIIWLPHSPRLRAYATEVYREAINVCSSS